MTMESNKHHPVANDEILVEKLCEAFKDARKNGTARGSRRI
jgi:hypothetical protein